MGSSALAHTVSSPPIDRRDSVGRIRDSVNRVIVGKEEVTELALVALLSRGHLLLEDIPGVGKSTLARALAGTLGGAFRRVQFTSDLLPADVLGVSVWRPEEGAFEFRRGPIFANVLLADEINRSPPRTQSALLEAMAEEQVSVDGVTHPLPRPFLVLATQNPLEHYGTYPLPESQRDRFALRVRLGYAQAQVEAALLTSGRTQDIVVEPVTTPQEIAALQDDVDRVFVHPDVAAYAQAVVAATRTHPAVALGVSTRGALAWVRAARARAYLAHREHVSIDDLQELAAAALAHRLVVAAAARVGETEAEHVLTECIANVAVPR